MPLTLFKAMPILTRPWALKRLLPWWPPYWGTGIKVDYVAEDYREIVVGMKLSWYNRNYVGTHFGGSLFAMTDPFYMLMTHKALGNQYYVWDKAGCIDFIKPGLSKVTARFVLTDAMLEDIRRNTAGGDKYFVEFRVEIKDETGELIAEVVRTLYIRKKKEFR
ncbi:MAG TPA: DUF4442 domain-containing protein [Gammaproteobacteria bacterium]|jgi:acyl-coenzyme A thioesterase PaaI-like protein